jgi:hypothetical protein
MKIVIVTGPVGLAGAKGVKRFARKGCKIGDHAWEIHQGRQAG